MVKTALLIVDVQNDFLPGGALGVENGHRVLEPIERLSKSVDLVIASRDYHPADHCSFEGDNPWPVHCVENTFGSELHGQISSLNPLEVLKGTDRDIEEYSAFAGTDSNANMLHEILRDNSVVSVIVCGIATDYCVKATVLDALELGYNVTVHVDATAGVNVNPDDVNNAIAEMAVGGATIFNWTP